MKKNYILIIILFLWAHVATGQKPVANFTASADPTCAGSCISFIDESTNNPTSWKWTFTGATPASSSNQYPMNICYSSSGSFGVKLVVANSSGNDSLTINNFIVVNPDVVPYIFIDSNYGDTACAGTLVTFNTYPSNEGTNPAYQWYVNGSPVGTDSSRFSISTLNNGDVVTVHILNINTPCAVPDSAVSNGFQMVIESALSPSLMINAYPQGAISPGTNVIFIADTTNGNGGDYPSFQWYKNGHPVGTNGLVYSDSNLNSGDTITCMMTSSNYCAMPQTATSNEIIMQVITGIGEAANKLSLFISPNPAITQLTLHLVGWTSNAVNTSFNNEHTTVSIMNVLGQDVSTPLNVRRSLSEVEVDVSKLAAGVYFLQLRSAGGSATKMFVKE